MLGRSARAAPGYRPGPRAAAATPAARRSRSSDTHRGGLLPSRLRRTASIGLPIFSVDEYCSSPRTSGGDLMDQCSEPARHPISATDDLTNRPGHDLLRPRKLRPGDSLTLGIDHHSRRQQCSPTGGSVISLPLNSQRPRQGHADRHPLGVSPRRHRGRPACPCR
jgi:hypothetical protein